MPSMAAKRAQRGRTGNQGNKGARKGSQQGGKGHDNKYRGKGQVGGMGSPYAQKNWELAKRQREEIRKRIIADLCKKHNLSEVQIIKMYGARLEKMINREMYSK